MSFLTPLGWALTATGILAPAGIPMILADKTRAGEAAGKAVQDTAVKAVTTTGQAISQASLSEAKAADFQILDQSVKSLVPRTKASSRLRDDWLRWHNGLSFWDSNFNDAAYNEGRNRWIDLMVADTVPPANPEDTRLALRLVPSVEQTQGLADPRDSRGYYPVQSPSIVPTSFKVGAALSAVAILGGLIFFNRR